MSKKIVLIPRIFVVLPLLLTTTSQAQEVADDNLVQDDFFSLSLEQLLNVEVETRKTKESYLSVPLSSSILTREDLNLQHIHTLNEASEFFANYSFRQSFGKLQERGVTRGVANIVGDNVTGIFLDGLAISNFANTISLDDFEYVELIRGPQATLYGRSTFAGAVNLALIDPREKLTNKARMDFSEDGWEKLQLKIGQQFSGNSALQLNLSFQDRQGHLSNVTGDGGGRVDDQEQTYLSANYAFNYEDFDVQLYGMALKDRDSGYPVVMQLAEANNCFLETSRQYYCGTFEVPSTFGVNNDFLLTQDFNGYKNDASWISAKVGYPLSPSSEVLVKYAWSDSDSRYFVDGDYSPVSFAWQDVGNQYTTHEFELLYSWEFNDKLKARLGLSYFQSQSRQRVESFLDLFGTVTPTPPRMNNQDVDNSAIFTSFDYTYSDDLEFILDLRYAQDKIGFDNGRDQGSSTFDSISPKLTFRKSFDNQAMLFSSLSRGTKPGGFNIQLWGERFDPVIDQQQRRSFYTFEQEYLWQFEVGYKGLFQDGTLSLQAAAFVGDWQQLQTNQSITFELTGDEGITQSVITNQGAATSRGIEVEAIKQLNQATKLWSSWGWVDSEFEDAGTVAQEQLTGNASVSGNKIPNVPSQTFAIGLSREHEMTTWQLSSFASFHHEASRYIAEHNLAKVAAVNKFRAGINLAYQAWQASLFGIFAEDSGYIESAARLGDPASSFRLRAFALSIAPENSVNFEIQYSF